MELDKYYDAARDCLKGSAPPCSLECPFGLDVREFIGKFSAVSVSAAYKILERDLTFPAVTCQLCPEPCRPACVRGGLDEGLHVRAIEAACVQEAAKKASRAFFVADKGKAVAVIGAGPAGLSFASKLAGRGYGVTIFEAGQAGGSLRDMSLGLAEGTLEALIEKVRSSKYIELVEGAKAESASDLAGEYDAVVLATGSQGKAPDIAGAFVIGSAKRGFSSVLESIREGAQASFVVENFLKVGRVIPTPERAGLTFPVSLVGVEAQKSALSGGEASLEQAKAEAARCLLCDCRACEDACEVLEYYKKTAKKLITDTSDTLNKTMIVKKTALAPLLSCNDCGRCGKVCPVGIDLGEMAMAARQQMRRLGMLPKGYYDYYLSDMAHAGGAGGFAHHTAGASLVFFPGCQLPSARPFTAEAIYRFLCDANGGDAGILASCCGAPALWAGDGEAFEENLARLRSQLPPGAAIVTACPSCEKMLRRYLPEAHIESLISYMASSIEARPARGDERFLFHACIASGEAREAARLLVSKLGYGYIESEEEACCGYGGLAAARQQSFTEAEAVKNAAIAPDLEYICYCSNCADTFEGRGKAAGYIYGLALGVDEEGEADLTKRRENRMSFQERLAGATGQGEEGAKVKLIYGEGVREKMNASRILEDTAIKVIEAAEATGEKAYDEGRDCYVAHLREANMTFWAAYRIEEEGVRLLNCYGHRMQIVERGESV